MDARAPRRALQATADAAATCTACPLYRDATQTVFGEGSTRADLMLVGEQPGDREDVAGRPFVGPAGRLLDDVLVEAGIDSVSVTADSFVRVKANVAAAEAKRHH